jgi:hypothetical protein
VVPGLDRSGDLLCYGPYANHGVLLVLLDIPWYRLVYPFFFWDIQRFWVNFVICHVHLNSSPIWG